MINAFSPEPLKSEQMDEFYCEETMEFRMSDKYSSPMEDIYDICQKSGGRKSFLLLGHKGCGKSTELNDTRFAAMKSYFITKTLPMIKIETIEGEAYENGIDVIQKIVEKRTRLDLFEEGVLKELINYTGGLLRDLFHVINASAKRAERRKSTIICHEDAQRALEELKTSLTRRIEKKDYEFLMNICKGNKTIIEDKEVLLKMLQASVVLEYNGKRWHNVHPLVVQFLKEQGLFKDVRR